MLKRTLILFALTLTQISCSFEEEQGAYRPLEFTPYLQDISELEKRELFKIEDIKIGNGPIAASGRKIIADITVRYASDGTIVYQGPAVDYPGMRDSVGIHNSLVEDGLLSSQQRGIVIGLNGMAVGGKRQFTIHPKLVCEWPGQDKANPSASCTLVHRTRLGGGPVTVRKEPLIVEATLTDSCTPVILRIPFLFYGEFRCRSSNTPQRDPNAPIWRFYHADPSQP